MVEAVQRQPDADAAVLVVRGLRRHELLRIAFADLLGRLDVIGVCEAISATTEATLDAALQAATNAVAAERGLDRRVPVRIAVIAMGRLGGMETGYGSDADVMFVYEPRDPAIPGPDDLGLAQRVIVRLRAMLAAPSTDPPLGVDADLRPEGRDGPLVRSLASYAQYYARWSSPWEAQALLRARFVVGDADLGARFIEMIDPVRYPAEGVSHDQLLEIRRIKGRVDSERLPRGADPATHTKLGRGGLADIEWTVQLLQLSHGAAGAAAAHPADAGRDPRGARRRPARRRRRRDPGRGLAHGHPGPQRDHAGARQGDRPAAVVRARAGRGRPGDGLSGRLRPRPADRRLPAGHPAGPPGRRSRSSTASRRESVG